MMLEIVSGFNIKMSAQVIVTNKICQADLQSFTIRMQIDKLL